MGVVITEIKAKLSSSLIKLANWNWAWKLYEGKVIEVRNLVCRLKGTYQTQAYLSNLTEPTKSNLTYQTEQNLPTYQTQMY